jgi:putative ABC transport system permease protein
MIAKAGLILDILLLLVFMLGIVIMYTSILSTMKERLHESAMLQILGANKRFVLKVLSIEFIWLGFVSGLLAASIALWISHDIGANFFELNLGFNLKWLAIGVISSTLVIWIFGIIGTRQLFRVSPLWLLKERSI